MARNPSGEGRAVANRGDDPRARRHARTKARILREAWKLASRDGLAALSLGQLAGRVDMRQPSLYTYFASKHALFDAMFREGNDALWEAVAEREYPADPFEELVAIGEAIVAFCAADTVRYQLLFQRPIPGFEPSPEAYAAARRFYDWFLTRAERLGLGSAEDVDVFTALIAGLAAQQVANDPGGDRWLRHTRRVLGVFVRELTTG